MPTDALARVPLVLVVDDDLGVRTALNAALTLHGMRVLLATGGREAVDLFRAHRRIIDLVLLDVHMPGQDGPATLEAMRALEPEVRCCLMTGYAGSEEEEGLRRSCAVLVHKPFTLDGVRRTVKDLLAHV